VLTIMAALGRRREYAVRSDCCLSDYKRIYVFGVIKLVRFSFKLYLLIPFTPSQLDCLLWFKFKGSLVTPLVTVDIGGEFGLIFLLSGLVLLVCWILL